MKKIRMILLAACPALFCPVPGSMAQVRQGSVTVQVNELAQRGDSLYVDMAVTTEGRARTLRRCSSPANVRLPCLPFRLWGATVTGITAARWR